MRHTLRAGVAIATMLVVMGASVAPTQAVAPKPGTSCKPLGAKIVSGKLTYTCTKSGTKLIWSKGTKLPLVLAPISEPAAISRQPYRFVIEASGGTGYHFCTLKPGSGLPPGYSLNRKTCVITGVGEVLPAGTTKRISPPITIIITDSASPKPETVSATFTITTFASVPVIKVSSDVIHCQVSKECNSLAATVAGGTPPYRFRNGTGFPPLGIVIETVGNTAYLRGIPKTPDSRSFDICVIDFVSIADCEAISVTVDPASTFVVKVSKSGDGEGTVTSDSLAIDCGDLCVGEFVADEKVVLTTRAEIGSVFAGWWGDCTGKGQCTLDVNADKTVSAFFILDATGRYIGSVMWPDLSVPERYGCYGGSHLLALEITDSGDGRITGGGDYVFSGTRVGSTITVTLTTSFGPRGPYVWQWNRTSLSGTLPYFCWLNSTGALLSEAPYAFDLMFSK